MPDRVSGFDQPTGTTPFDDLRRSRQRRRSRRDQPALFTADRGPGAGDARRRPGQRRWSRAPRRQPWQALARDTGGRAFPPTPTWPAHLAEIRDQPARGRQPTDDHRAARTDRIPRRSTGGGAAGGRWRWPRGRWWCGDDPPARAAAAAARCRRGRASSWRRSSRCAADARPGAPGPRCGAGAG